MRALSWLVSAMLGLAAGLVLGWALLAHAQPQTAAPQTCEQQLEQATRTILQLRKANAQADFRNATLEEAMMDLTATKHSEPKTKAEEKK